MTAASLAMFAAGSVVALVFAIAVGATSERMTDRGMAKWAPRATVALMAAWGLVLVALVWWLIS